MANIIHVSPEKLIAAAAGFSGAAEEVKALTGSMTATVSQLSGRVWSGEAAAGYVRKFNGLQGDMNRFHGMIVKHSEQLKTIAREFTGAETENTAQAAKLANNVIS